MGKKKWVWETVKIVAGEKGKEGGKGEEGEEGA